MTKSSVPPSSKKSKVSRPLRVFLCHSSRDKPAVRNLYERLLDDGIEPWLDEEDILPGQDWEREIAKAVRNADVVIVCLSEKSVTKSGYVQKEIRYALDIAEEQPEGTIFIIPLKLQECDTPEQLRRWQWVNFFDEWEKGYKKLLRALQIRATDLGFTLTPKPAGKPSVAARSPEKAVIVNIGQIYPTINLTDCLQWPSPEIKQIAGQNGWKDFEPKVGDKGIIIAKLPHCSNPDTVHILKIKNHYVPIGRLGIKIIKDE